MAKKVTYGKRDNGKRPLPYDNDSAHDDDESRKRSKTDDDELEKLQFLGKKAKKPSLLKRGLHNGPVSFSNDDGDIESAKKKTVFDKVLSEGRHQAAKPDQFRSRGDYKDLGELIKRQKSQEEYKRDRYLPTPPAEAERKAHQQARRDATFSHTNGCASKDALKTSNSSAAPTQTSQLFAKVIKNEQPKEPYQPRAYKADKILAPRRNILENRLSRSSKEAKMWSKNQAESPFLRLPAQVRNTIYEYALGGKTILIDYETYRNTYKGNKLRKSTPVFKYHCTVYDKKPFNPFGKVKLSYLKSYSSFTPLNNICRQLYRETAVLPYKLNLICFGSHNIMFNFLFREKRLARQHREALTQMVLPDGLPGSNMVGCLPNLERVFLADDQDGNRQGDWYYVVRQEGEVPKLQRKRK